LSGNRRRVLITGLGIVSPIGKTVHDFFDSLLCGRSGIRLVPETSHAAGMIQDFEAPAFLSKAQLIGVDRVAQLGLVAAEQAIQDAGPDSGRAEPARTGLYLGTGVGGAGALEDGYRNFFSAGGHIPPLTVVGAMTNATAGHISMRHEIRGPTLTYSVACASSAVAIGEAFRAIRDGYLDVAIAGGAEAMITPGVISAWGAMRVLAKPDPDLPERSCRPFSKDRTGLVLGEGAGVLVLEAFDSASDRPVKVWAELAGYGIASDAQHISRPDADGQCRAMTAALEDAGLPASGIGYVNAHGTATPVGDIVETEAIKRAFGPAAHAVPVSSTKALHGHLMGAAGAVEMIAAIMALANDVLPPTCHYSEPDPRCDLDYIPNTARRIRPMEAVMSNSFAFGGTNAVLVARKFVRPGA